MANGDIALLVVCLKYCCTILLTSQPEHCKIQRACNRYTNAAAAVYGVLYYVGLFVQMLVLVEHYDYRVG